MPWERYHPDLATLDELQGDQTEVLSTCLPLIATIERGEEEMRILTWNLQASIKFKVDQNKRYSWLWETLQKILAANSFSFIALQDLNEDLCKLLKEKLTDWQIRHGDYNSVTFCRSDVVESKNSVLIREGFIGLKVECRIDTTPVEVCNISKSLLTEVEKEEEMIKTLLYSGHKHTVVIGNFNSEVAPLDNERRNITTSVAVDSAGNQVGQFNMGCFYSNSDNNIIVLKQAKMQTLNLKTGECYSDTEALCPTERQQNDLVTTYEPVLCIGDHYFQKKIIENLNIFEYEKKLQTQFADKSLAVYPMRNLNNEEKIAISFDLSVRPLLQEHTLAPTITFWQDTQSNRVTVVLLPTQLADFQRRLNEAAEVLAYKSIIDNYLKNQVGRLQHEHKNASKTIDDQPVLTATMNKWQKFSDIKNKLINKVSLAELKAEVLSLRKEAATHRVTTGITGFFNRNNRKTASVKALDKIVDENADLIKTKSSRCCCF